MVRFLRGCYLRYASKKVWLMYELQFIKFNPNITVEDNILLIIQ